MKRVPYQEKTLERMKVTSIFLLSGLLAYASATGRQLVCEAIANRIYVLYQNTKRKLICFEVLS